MANKPKFQMGPLKQSHGSCSCGGSAKGGKCAGCGKASGACSCGGMRKGKR